MNAIESHHTFAMDLAERAIEARLKRNYARAAKLFRWAFYFERKAATAYAAQNPEEPSRSILFRSAAALGLNALRYEEAEKLVFTALTGSPPDYLAGELRDLLDEINFHRHISLQGVILTEREFQMSLAGNAVGKGIVQSDIFMDKFQTTERILYRIAERKLGKPFREKGRIENRVKNEFQLFLSLPRAASYAITVRIGKPAAQPELPEMPGAEQIKADVVIDEFLSALNLVNEKDEDGLKKLIPEPDYFDNFVALAKELAPDGDNLKMLGFTTGSGETERSLIFRRNRSTFIRIPEAPTENMVEVIGTLSYADARQSRIRITDGDDQDHIVLVPKAVLADVVKPLWEDKVLLRGIKTKKNELKLVDIEKYSEPNGA